MTDSDMIEREMAEELRRLETELSDKSLGIQNLSLEESETELEADLAPVKPLIEESVSQKLISETAEVFCEPKKVLDIREFKGREYIDLLLGDSADEKVEFVSKSDESEFNFGKTYDFSRAVCDLWPSFDYEKLDQEIISKHKQEEDELRQLQDELIIPSNKTEWPKVEIKNEAREIAEAEKLMRKLTAVDKHSVVNQAHSNLLDCKFEYKPEEIEVDEADMRSELGSLADLLENARAEDKMEEKAKARRKMRIMNWVKGRKNKNPNLQATRNLKDLKVSKTVTKGNKFKSVDLDDIPPAPEWKIKYGPEEAFKARRNLRDYLNRI